MGGDRPNSRGASSPRSSSRQPAPLHEQLHVTKEQLRAATSLRAILRRLFDAAVEESTTSELGTAERFVLLDRLRGNREVLRMKRGGEGGFVN